MINHTIFVFLFLALLPVSHLACAEISDHIDHGLLPQSDQIEIVRVNDKFSHIEYKKSRPEISSLSPALSGFSLRGAAILPFGPCTFENNTLLRTGAGDCGFILDLSEKNALMNLLSYDSVNISGYFTGTWKVAIVDFSHYLGNDSVPFGTIRGGSGRSFALAPLTAMVDLTQAKSLLFVLGSNRGTLSLSNVSFTRTPKSPPLPGNGIWIWDIRRVLGQEAVVAEKLRSRGIQSAYLQVGDDPAVLQPFVKQAALRGIRVLALDGSPTYVREPGPLLKRIRAVLDFNVKNPESPFEGFQIDVEPYLNKDFSVNREYYSAGYVQLLQELEKMCKGKLRLSTVIPFWFDKIPAGERNLAFRAIDLADETVIMSYRSDYGALLETARDILAYGEKKGKPVLLGIEINHIADEQHAVLRRVEAGKEGAVELGGFFWEKIADYPVLGGNLSFFGKLDDAWAVIGRKPGYKSFAGWVIHSYEGLK